jgi:hypothetical protein
LEALRLDVVKANPFLKDYYEGKGFKVLKEGKSHGVDSFFLEKSF